MFSPTSKIKLLANVDIDNTYINTFSWTSATAQSNFFLSKIARAVDNVTFVRKDSVIRVPVNVEELWNVGYMMFQNTNFGSKWFYAFITNMTYVNDGMTEITFEIDAIQTWYFDMDIKNCYIEREHVSNDAIGLHTVEENLYTGEPVINQEEIFIDGRSMAIIIATTQRADGTDVSGDSYGKVYSGLGYYAFEPNDTFGVNNFIAELTALGKADSIRSIFLAPESTLPLGYVSGDLLLPNFNPVDTVNLSLLTSLNGYTPRNNKMFTFPYNFIVCNAENSAMIYRYEYFSVLPSFEIRGVSTGTPQIQCVPKNYKGLAKNIEESITLSGYPQCAWVTDVYSNWLAQKAASNSVGLVGSLIGAGAGIVSGNPMLGSTGVLGVADSIGSFYEMSVVPNSANGSLQSDVNLAYSEKTFKFFQKTIRSEMAKIIDDYFHKYGYKVNSLRTPNLRSRANWNFIKTHEANIFGDVPSSDLVKIRAAFNNGITFWHNDNVGNYNRSNSII